MTRIFLYRISLCILTATILCVALVSVVYAQQQQFISLSKIEGDIPGIWGDVAPMSGGGNISTLINRAFTLTLTIGGMIAVGRLVYAGWLYMMGDSWAGEKKAKTIMANVVIGGLTLFFIWLILNLINPQILNIDDSFRPFNRGAGQGGGSAQPTTGAGFIN